MMADARLLMMLMMMMMLMFEVFDVDIEEKIYLKLAEKTMEVRNSEAILSM